MRFTQLLPTTVGALLVFAGTAAAQYGQYGQYGGQYGQYGGQFGGQYGGQYQLPSQTGQAVNPNNYLQNYYNPQYQPLSPYLNLFRGSNPATNYYYGVRPGTLGVGQRGFGGGPFMAFGGNRMMFFPQLAAAPDPLIDPTLGQPGNVIPPAGHPVVYGNTMGFFPSPTGQAGAARSGLSGLGAGRR